MEFRTIKYQFRAKFVLNRNQDWRFSLGIGHVKSFAPEKDGKTFQDRVKDAVVEKVMEKQ